MKTPGYFSLLIAPDAMHVAGTVWMRHVIGVVFIALMALFFTAPVPEAPSAYDRPLPMPAELGLDNDPAASFNR